MFHANRVMEKVLQVPPLGCFKPLTFVIKVLLEILFAGDRRAVHLSEMMIILAYSGIV